MFDWALNKLLTLVFTGLPILKQWSISILPENVKTSENIWFSDDFRRVLKWNIGLKWIKTRSDIKSFDVLRKYKF